MALLLLKEQKRANRSSTVKGNKSDFLFFVKKKQAICTKNQRASSQPWKMDTNSIASEKWQWLLTNLVTLALYKIFFVVFLFLPNKKSLSSLNTSLKRNKLNKNNIVGSLALILFVLLFFVDMFIKVSSTVHITVGFADL